MYLRYTQGILRVYSGYTWGILGVYPGHTWARKAVLDLGYTQVILGVIL